MGEYMLQDEQITNLIFGYLLNSKCSLHIWSTAGKTIKTEHISVHIGATLNNFQIVCIYSR
jgi:hypothetical protein